MSSVIAQVTTNEIKAIVGPEYFFGSFYSTADQPSAGNTSVNKMTYNVTDFSNGVSIASNSRITIANAGKYNIEFSAQLSKSDSGDDIIEIWLCKNGSNMANTNTQVTLVGNNGRHLASWNWFVDAAAGDYYEICWYSSDAAVLIDYVAAGTNPTRPAIPSVILTVNKIG